DVTAAGGDDVVPQAELGVPTVQDVAAVGLQALAQLLLLLGPAGVGGGGHVHAHGHAALDLEVGGEAPAAVGLAVLVREVGGGGEAGQGTDDAAIEGRTDLRDLAAGSVAAVA